MRYLFHLFYLFFPFFLFSVFVSTFFLRFWTFCGLFFSSSVFLFSPVLAGGDFGALDGDSLPCVTWVHPSSSLLLGWSPVSVGCVSGMLIFGVVFVVIDVDDTDENVPVVLVFFLWTGSGEVAYLFTVPALRLLVFRHHHHGLILVVQCMKYCLETSSV